MDFWLIFATASSKSSVIMILTPKTGQDISSLADELSAFQSQLCTHRGYSLRTEVGTNLCVATTGGVAGAIS